MDTRQNIIFLDEHGVIVSRNAMIANSYVPHNETKTHTEMADPIAVNMINHLAYLMDASIVTVSSLRRNFDSRDDYVGHMQNMGLDSSHLARDWRICTEQKFRLKREQRIKRYLENYAEHINQYLIIDDIKELKNVFTNIVSPDSREGFKLRDYNQALRLIGRPLELTCDLVFQSNDPVWERYPHAAAKP